MLRARGRFCGLPITLAPGLVFSPRPATERLVRADVVVANLPYLPDSSRDRRYDTEPDEAVYALGDGLGPVRRLLDECREGMLAAGGVVLIQLYGSVLAANRAQVDSPRARHHEEAA